MYVYDCILVPISFHIWNLLYVNNDYMILSFATGFEYKVTHILPTAGKKLNIENPLFL